MNEDISMVKVILKHGMKINYVTTATGKKSSLVSTRGTLSMVRGRLYHVPVNTNQSFDQNHYFKLIGHLSESIDIRNIQDGFAVIIPLVHNTTLNDKDELGYFL